MGLMSNSLSNWLVRSNFKTIINCHLCVSLRKIKGSDQPCAYTTCTNKTRITRNVGKFVGANMVETASMKTKNVSLTISPSWLKQIIIAVKCKLHSSCLLRLITCLLNFSLCPVTSKHVAQHAFGDSMNNCLRKASLLWCIPVKCLSRLATGMK